MRTVRVIILFCVLLVCGRQLRADVYNRSYLTMRPRFELAFPERIVSFRDRIGARKNGHDLAVQVVPFMGQTTDQSGIARYFLPNDKDYLIVGEDASPCAVNDSRDISAAQFGIFTTPLTNAAYDAGYPQATFESRVDFAPCQKTVGVGFTFGQLIRKKVWWDIAFPIVQVQNTMGIQETIVNRGGGSDVGYGSFTESITNTAERKYGNIKNGWLTKTGVSQIEVRVGRNVLTDCCIVGSYFGLLIPTGNKPNQKYMFEPVLGNNKHWAFLLGGYGAAELMRDSHDRTVNAVFTSVTRYLVPNTQMRSFDLRGKPWSRYMYVWESDNQTVANNKQLFENLRPLINYTTMCVRVHPHYAYDFNFGLNYVTKKFRAEVGYNLYARRTEDINFNRPMQSNVGIAAIKKVFDGMYPSGVAHQYTNSLATIRSPVLKLEAHDCAGRCDERVNPSGQNTDPIYLPITIDDVDQISGSHPGTVSQTLYGALSFVWDKWECPFFFNGGGSYEFSSDNSTISRWTAWLKLGVSV